MLKICGCDQAIFTVDIIDYMSYVLVALAFVFYCVLIMTYFDARNLTTFAE